MATPEDPIRLMADAWPAQRDAKLATLQAKIDKLEAKKAASDPRAAPMIDRDINAVREQMQAVSDYQPLHFTPDDMQAIDPPSMALQDRRKQAGFPPKGLAAADDAKRWETLADATISRNQASNYEKWPRNIVDKNLHWLQKVTPETPVFAEETGLRNLGFGHLVDELRNAITPDSGLPANLLLKYSDLSKVTVPQAVKRVADINAWRAAQKVAADKARANNAATVLHKDYPDVGLKWVELRANRLTPEELTAYKEANKPQPGAWRPAVEPTDEQISKDLSESALQDALKYEGDTMGHCVGGYCDEVLQGHSRIFSLRDARGQPHVTIETNPGDRFTSRNRLFDITQEQYSQISKRAEELLLSGKYGNNYDEALTDAANEAFGAPAAKIKQIKGKQNRAPSDEYLPYVQDFVRSGTWSDVGDFQNTGLKRLSDMGDEPMIKAAREKLGDYATQDEWDAIMRGEGFASGGLVSANDYDPAKIDSIVAQLKAEMYA